MSPLDDSAMDIVPGFSREAPHTHSDPAVNARLQNFPDTGRHLVETWLKDSDVSARHWKICLKSVRDSVRLRDERGVPITEAYMNWIKGVLNPIGFDAREAFSFSGMKPEMLMALFGDPNEYNVKMCLDESLLDLLRHRNDIDLLIGTWLLSKITDDDEADSKVAKRLKNAFTQNYYGPGAQWLGEGLRRYMDMYKGEYHFGKVITVLQSSGAGKSRVAAELARLHWGVSVCFRDLGSRDAIRGRRDPRDGYPFGDLPVCQFLHSPPIPSESELVPLKGEEIAAAFIGALFLVMHDTIEDARRETAEDPKRKAKDVFDCSWGVPDTTRFENSPRTESFRTVREKAIELLVSNSQEILAARDCMSVSIMGWVMKLYYILIDPAAHVLEQDRLALDLPCFTFIFDECSLLNSTSNDPAFAKHGSIFDHISLLALQRMIKACDSFKFWFFMLDTTSRVHDTCPGLDKETTSSWRLRGNFKPLPPWPYLPFDVMVPPPKDLPQTPLEALCLSRLKVYGRPLWSMCPDDELMITAATKLLCDNPRWFLRQQYSSMDTSLKEKTKLQVLALHSARFILNLRAEDAANAMALASVKSHLRVLTYYDAEKRIVASEVPSEPILAIAAGKLLLDDKEKYREVMQILVEELLQSNKIISEGENGETLARIVLVVNRDATVQNIGGQLCIAHIYDDAQQITNRKDDGRILRENLRYAVRPFTLASYLRNLVHTDLIIPENLGVFQFGMDWAAQVHMNFTHFVQLDNFVESYLSYEFVLMCWRRGCALQCIRDQAIIDMLLIGYRGDLTKPFDPLMFVFVVVQIKNQIDAASLTSINSITCPFLQNGSERWKPEYMVILMDMGTSTHFPGTRDDLVYGNLTYKAQVRVTQGKAVKGKVPWSSFEADKEYSAVRFNIRGLAPYRSLAEWAPAVFQHQRQRNLGRTNFSMWSDALTSTTRVMKDALTLSLEDMQDRHEQRSQHWNPETLKGDIILESEKK